MHAHPPLREPEMAQDAHERQPHEAGVESVSPGCRAAASTIAVGKAKAVDAEIEPHVGGRWYERGDNGSTCDGATCSRANRTRGSCSPGKSAPTGSTTRN
jgi:hypothetical protein